jgi:hypothetical protein
MATTTFDKEIIIDEAAARRFIAALEKPPREIPDLSKYMIQGEEEGMWFLKDWPESSGAGKNPV